MRIYDHENHCYYNTRASYKLVDAMANTKGVHGNPIAEKQPNNLYMGWLIGFLVIAILCGGGFHTVEEKRCDWWVCL